MESSSNTSNATSDLLAKFKWLTPELLNVLWAAGGTYERDFCQGLESEAQSRQMELDNAQQKKIEQHQPAPIGSMGEVEQSPKIVFESTQVEIPTASSASQKSSVKHNTIPLLHGPSATASTKNCRRCVVLGAHVEYLVEENTRLDGIRLKQIAEIQPLYRYAEKEMRSDLQMVHTAQQDQKVAETLLAEASSQLSSVTKQLENTTRQNAELSAASTLQKKEMETLEERLACVTESRIEAIEQLDQKMASLSLTHAAEVTDLKDRLVDVRETWEDSWDRVWGHFVSAQKELEDSQRLQQWTRSLFLEAADDAVARIKRLEKDTKKGSAAVKALARAERHLEVLRPISIVATKVRRRFWASGKPVAGKDAILEAGNRAAHEPR